MTGMVSVETSHTHTHACALHAHRVNSPDVGQHGLLRIINLQIEETFLDISTKNLPH